VTLAVSRRAFRRRVLELDGCDDIARTGIDGRERPNRPAVIGEDDLVVGLVVHDAVQSRANLDLLDDGKRLQIEHRDRLVARVGREAMTGFGGDTGAVYTWRIRDVAEHAPGRALHHHDVTGA